MMRIRPGTYTAFAVLFLVLVIPHVVFGATSPIVPQVGSTCFCAGSAPDYGCILQIIQNVINVAVMLGVTLCVIWIAYAGFMMMLTGGSPEARSQSKTRIGNAVIGIALILCSWLVVDFVMKTIYNPGTTFETNTFGPWNTILAPASGSECIKQTTPQSIVTGSIGILTGVPAGTSNASNGGVLSSSGTGACDASQVQQGAASGGFQISAGAASALACLAQNESGCGTNNQNFNWGKGSSAYGPFQVLLGNNGDAYNNNACDAAVGLPAGTSLNCKAGFSGGNPIPGSPIVDLCKRAATNLACSASAVAKLTNNASKAGLTSAYGSSAKDLACINSKYGS